MVLRLVVSGVIAGALGYVVYTMMRKRREPEHALNEALEDIP